MSANLSPNSVLTALKEVNLPGANVDIVSIKLVGDIQVSGGQVRVMIVKTSEKDETIEAVRQAVVDKVSNLSGVLAVEVAVDDRSEPKKKAPAGPHGQSPDPFADRRPLPMAPAVKSCLVLRG